MDAQGQPGPFDWTRYWAARDAVVSSDADDFIVAPTGPLGSARNPALVTLDDLAGGPCLILLGEPGLGKSTTLSQWTGGCGASGDAAKPNLIVNLAEFNDVNELRAFLDGQQQIGAWLQGGEHLCLWLDSLDEAQLHMPRISQSLLRYLSDRADDLCRLRLRVVSRTAEWPASFERQLMALFGPGNVVGVELLALSRADVAMAATARCVDAEAFLEEVTRVGAGALAARPLTLRLLLTLFASGASFSDNKAELFEQGCRQLCSTIDEGRRNAIPLGAHYLDSDELMVVAGRLAATTQLGAFEGLSLTSAGEANERFPTPSMLVGGNEPVRRSTAVVDAVVFDSRSIEAVLRTGLFSSRGEGFLGWTDRRFADYLCARYLMMDRGVGAERAARLLTVDCYGERHVTPQLASLAVWCAQLDEGFMLSLIGSDPDLIVSERMQVPESVRPGVVASLLEACEQGRLVDRFIYTKQYASLAHDGLAEQLAPYIADRTRSERAREVAMYLAQACAVGAVVDHLVAVALNADERYHLRVVAAIGVARTGSPEQRGALLPLLEASYDDDSSDELRGCVLEAVWPELIDAEALFGALREPKQKNLIGLYRGFVHGLERSGVPTGGLSTALGWVADSTWAWAHVGPFDNLVDRVLADAVLACDDDVIGSHLAEVLVAMCESNGVGLTHGLEAYRRAVREDDEHRRLLTRAVVARVAATGASGIEVVSWRLSLLRSIDVPWMLEEARAATDAAVRETWLELIERLFDPALPGHAATALQACEEIEELRERMARWLRPVALDSKEAEDRRARMHMLAGSRQREEKKEAESEVPEHDVHDHVRVMLDICELGHADALAQLTLDMARASEEQDLKDLLEPDLRTLVGWPSDDPTKERFVAAARAFVLGEDPESTCWLGTTRLYLPALAGYKALRLLLDTDPGFVRDNEAQLFTRWTSIIIAFPLSRDDPAGLHRAVLIEKAYEHAPDQVLECVEALVRKENEAGLPGEPLRVLGAIFDERCETMLLRLAKDVSLSSETTGAVFDCLVVTHDSSLGRELARAFLLEDLSEERGRLIACRCAAALLRCDASEWPTIWELMQRDSEFGRALVGYLAFLEESERVKLTGLLPADVRASLYLWTLQEFPRNGDGETEGVSAVTPRRRIGWWRDSLLLRLAGEGTEAAVEAVQRIKVALPQVEWLANVELDAKDAVRRRLWQPFPPGELYRLVGDERARSVVTPSDLLDVLDSALVWIQADLVRAETPAVLFLWNELADRTMRPKSEPSISDWLKRELERATGGRQVVVNREVEVYRTSSRGLGHQTDILVKAVHDDSVLTAIVEVKGCWNPEVETGMKNQLVDDYMVKTGCTAGLYVIGWFGCGDHSSCPGRSSLCSRMTADEARAHFAAQARDLCGEERDVRSLVLDLSRP